jgi:hypothetical protein
MLLLLVPSPDLSPKGRGSPDHPDSPAGPVEGPGELCRNVEQPARDSAAATCNDRPAWASGGGEAGGGGGLGMFSRLCRTSRSRCEALLSSCRVNTIELLRLLPVSLLPRPRERLRASEAFFGAPTQHCSAEPG